MPPFSLNQKGTDYHGDQDVSETSIIAQLATQFGAPGLLIGYMVWDRLLRRKDEQAEREEHNALLREWTQSNKEVTVALSALTTMIQGMGPK